MPTSKFLNCKCFFQLLTHVKAKPITNNLLTKGIAKDQPKKCCKAPVKSLNVVLATNSERLSKNFKKIL